MANSAAARQGDRPAAAPSVPAADFAELRSLIVGPEQRQLRHHSDRLDDPAAQMPRTSAGRCRRRCCCARTIRS